ncbi:DUF3592 domain-containing protein [Arthrobacter sp. NPDC090010]|uniref:DUF3592 domain-containing protein n=1 Tax=Arthrobacter sp. NPDC090010 TaxID=3363942 RepID=UPI0038121032
MKLALYAVWVLFSLAAIFNLVKLFGSQARRAGIVASWPRVGAVVTGNAEAWSTISGDNNPVRRYFALYQFSGPDGAVHQGRSELGLAAPTAPGTALEVAYNPLNADQSFHQSVQIKRVAWLVAVVFAVILVLAFLMITALPLPFLVELHTERTLDPILRIFLLVPGAFLAVGLVLAVIGILRCAVRWATVGRWVRTRGVVVSTGANQSPASGSGRSVQYRPEYRFPDALGQEIAGRADVALAEEPIIGQPLEVAYDPAAPQRSALPVFLAYRTLFGVGLVLSFFGAAGLTMFSFAFLG